MPESAVHALPEIDAQYRALREGAGLLDAADRGMLLVSGPEAAEYLQGQVTNDVEALEPGEGCYAALLDRKGRIQADMRLLVLAPDQVLIDTEAEGFEALKRHLGIYKVGRDVEVGDCAGERSLLRLIGPQASEIAVEPPAAEHSHPETSIGAVACRAVRTDTGVDLICAAGDAAKLSAALLDAGAAPVDEPAAEIVRVESGRPRFGREIDTATMPAEAGIVERAVSFSKGCYIGQETVARLHYKGKPNRHLRGLRGEALLRAGETLRLDDRDAGRIGTACLSPAHGPIGLAILRREAEPGSALRSDGGAATVVELPFGEQE